MVRTAMILLLAASLQAQTGISLDFTQGYMVMDSTVTVLLDTSHFAICEDVFVLEHQEFAIDSMFTDGTYLEFFVQGLHCVLSKDEIRGYTLMIRSPEYRLCLWERRHRRYEIILRN